MALDIFLAVAGAVLIIVGFAGTIVPVLPGRDLPPLYSGRVQAP